MRRNNQRYYAIMARDVLFFCREISMPPELQNWYWGVQSFFCEPYHSWEKGSVEQVNGLIRRYLTKGTDFNNVTAAEINRIEKLLNNRPRKCLNYRTPYEVFRLAFGALKD